MSFQPQESRIVYGSVLALAMVFASGCNKQPLPTAESQTVTVGESSASNQAARELRIAVIQDKTLSTGTTRTPQLALKELEPIIQAMSIKGGELAVGVIHDRSNLSFARLRIDAMPIEPVVPPKAENPLERRKQRAAMATQTEEFKAQRQAWENETEVRIGTFRTAVEPMLSMRPEAKHSPVWDAVRRADLFLSETESRNGATPDRYCFLITDGIDDVGALPVPVNSGARVLLVNGSGEMGSLGVLKPAFFESITAAFRQILTNESR